MPLPPLNPSNNQLLKINTRCRNKSHPSFVCQPPHHPKRKRSSWGDIRQRMVISLYPGALGCTIHSGWFEVWGEVTFTISFIYPCRFAIKTKRGYIYIKLNHLTTWVRLLFKNEMPRRLSRLSHSLTPLLLFLLVRYTHAQYIPPQASTLASNSLWRRDGGDKGSRDERSMGKRQGNDSRSLYLVSYIDFCLFGPPSPLSSSSTSDNTSTSISISQINRDVVSWCTVPRRGQDGEDQRGIPDGTLNGVTYVKANSWVQVSGT